MMKGEMIKVGDNSHEKSSSFMIGPQELKPWIMYMPSYHGKKYK